MIADDFGRRQLAFDRERARLERADRRLHQLRAVLRSIMIVTLILAGAFALVTLAAAVR